MTPSHLAAEWIGQWCHGVVRLAWVYRYFRTGIPVSQDVILYGFSREDGGAELDVCNGPLFSLFMVCFLFFKRRCGVNSSMCDFELRYDSHEGICSNAGKLHCRRKKRTQEEDLDP